MMENGQLTAKKFGIDWPDCVLQCGEERLSSKGHSQLVHMRIRYHFLADLHITLHHESRAEKRIL